MTKLRLRQIRSAINRPKDQKATLEALGLGRISKEVVRESTPQIQGMVDKVRHLIAVEAVK